MAAIDTNVLVRLCMSDHPDQCRRAQDYVRNNAPVYASQLTLLELVWVLGSVYQRPKQVILQALRALLDNRELNPEAPAALESALDRWERSKADFADCYILSAVQAQGQAPLATFDRKLGKLAGAVLI
jgi:predicted nucleic-acid-binding protein